MLLNGISCAPTQKDTFCRIIRTNEVLLELLSSIMEPKDVIYLQGVRRRLNAILKNHFKKLEGLFGSRVLHSTTCLINVLVVVKGARYDHHFL